MLPLHHGIKVPEVGVEPTQDMAYETTALPLCYSGKSRECWNRTNVLHPKNGGEMQVINSSSRRDFRCPAHSSNSQSGQEESNLPLHVISMEFSTDLLWPGKFVS